MFKYNNYLFAILDTIEKTKGWGLLLEWSTNKLMYSKFLDTLEKNKYIIINGKEILDDGCINYSYIEFTPEGRDYYLKKKNEYA